MSDPVNHPAHYGGADNPYEAIKVIEAWRLNFNLGNTVKYISRAEHKGATLQDLEKARWYLQREIDRMQIAVRVGNGVIDPNTCHHSWVDGWGGQICQYCYSDKIPKGTQS